MTRMCGWFIVLLCIPVVVCAQSIVGPDQMNQCDQATFTVTITNASATQSACFLSATHTLPNDGFVYVPGSTAITLNETAEIFTVDPINNVWNIDAIRGSAYALPPGESITLSYDMATTCAAVSGTDIITVDFENCAIPGAPLQNVSSTSVEILPGAVVISKTPSVQDASVGDPVTWTITVENTGLGTVSNVEIVDVLDSGLAFNAASDGGSNAGQTTTWNAGTTPALGSIAVGDTASVQLTAEVVSCANLINEVNATWGCGGDDVCYDTASDEGTATASLNLIVKNPDLSLDVPDVVLAYCSNETQVQIPIVNNGAGSARNVELCCSIHIYEVDLSRLPSGVSYTDGCFTIPDIAPAETFSLDFYILHESVDWCAGPPSGLNTFELTYSNDCGIPFVAYPQFSNCTSESGPSLAVTKMGPESLRLGEIGSYDITVEYVGSVDCGGSSPGAITIVDTYPEGFAVIEPAGGIVNGGARTITWTYNPADPPFDETIQLQAPTDCGYCAIPGGGTDDNTVTATGTDCCGCTITGTASAATTILCEGYGDGVALFSSTMSLNRTTVVRCSSSYDVEVTHTYVFANDPALDDLLLNEFTYFVDGNGDLLYEPGTAAVTGATLGAVVDGTPAGRLELRLTDPISVRNRTIVYSYHLSVLGLDDASCTASSYPIDAGIELDPGATSIDYCGTMYADPAQRLPVIAQPPAMSVSIDGIPTIQEYCATYDVTITLNRTSDLAAPRDVRLVLTNTGGSIIDMSQAVCMGDASPTDGTTCTAPVAGGSTYEWRFADAFVTGNEATLTFPVTVPCGGPLADLSVIALFDDRCHDDAVYDDSCSTSSSDQASLSLSADVYTRKSPEILYATTRYVSWSVVVHNTGNGVAYNTWVDDTLGSGLIYNAAGSSIDNAAGATEYPNVNHEGGAINGVSWIIDELQPGELRTITVAAELVACTGLTNNIAASWGCDDTSCQAPRTDSSSVIVPTGKLVATSFSPTPVPMCSDNPATVTMKNAGVTTLYNIAANVTLPAGLAYLGNPEFSVDGGTVWNPAGEPAIVGQLLTWTSAQVATLSDMAPKDVVKIRFDYTVNCGFQGGSLSFQATYENPCKTPRLSNIGSFTIGLTPSVVLTAVRQVSPAPGEAIDCGGQATWEIDVTNDGTVLIPVVQVVATLDDGLTFVSSTGAPGRTPVVDGGTNTGQTITWEIKDLAIDEVVTLSLTAASAAGGLDCDALDVFIDAAWGCGIVDGSSATNDADCTTTSPTTASISATRQPPLDLSASLSPGAIEGCDASTTLTLTIQNTSAVATTANIDVVITLPAQLSYATGTTQIDCGGGFAPAGNPNATGQTLTWYDIAAEGGASDACETIAPGGTIQLRFDVDVSCYFTTQSIPITVYSFDCCGNSQYTDNTSVPLTSLSPTLTIDKSPVNTTLDCYDAGDTATWTITVVNTGSGTADWIRVTDTLGASLVLDSSDSPTAGAGTAMGANIIGWEIGPLAPAATFTATVTAHLEQPSDDCALSLRRDTAAVLWGCGALDGDPNTTAEATCDIGSTIQDQANVRIPNLSISPSDITPTFTCSGDGVAPSSGEIQLVVRNTGDGDITTDFEITLTETTTGFSVSDRFTNLGGTLPLANGTSQTLTFAGWDVGCGSCSYNITAAVDFLDEICECSEDDNLASLPTTITLPDLVVDSAELTVSCSADGQIRIQGPVTLRNDGCGNPLTQNILVRFRVFDGADCTGSEIDTFTQTFSGFSLAANGGTDQQSINIVRTLAVCNVPDCQLSIRIEADDNNAICECDGTNNALCAGNFAIASPDLTITDIDFGDVTCASDTMAGFVRVTIANTGCGDSGAFDLRLATDGCLTFADEPVSNLAAGGSATVDFPVTGLWSDCGDCSCTFTATIDPADEVCECDGTNNALSEPFTSTLPDLEISGAVAAIGCAVDGNATVSANVTVGNTGCGDVAADFDILITVYDGANCTGNVVDTWIETISGETIAASGSSIITLTEYTLSQALCAGDCGYSAQFEVDASNDICECDGTDNTFCLSSILSEIPNLVVTDIDPVVDCRAATAQVTATVGNTGCGDATNVIFRLTSPTCGLTINSAPVDVATGTSQDIVFAYTPDCGNWNCTYIVTADPDETICECDGANSLTFDPYPGIGSIGDRVWFDFDGDGVQDPGEDGIPGVIVIIEGDLDNDGFIDYTAELTTDANGEYVFNDLPAGNYTITVQVNTLPAGLNQTYDYDGLGTAHTSDYTLAENEHNREQDFGYRGSGSIGDYVWFDINGDGVQDPSENGIANVSVTLQGDVDGDGINEILTTTTDANGLYLFDFLPAGAYTITVDDTTLPDGLAQTYDYDGLGTAHTSDYVLAAGEHNREQDFGYATPALSVDKVIADILRRGVSIGNITGPVEPGDVIVYQFMIENVGPVPAYSVGFDDTLPAGIVTETNAPGNAGSYVVGAPAASGSLGLSDGATAFNAPLGLTVNAGETLTATFTAIVTSAVAQGDQLTNTAHAYGEREDGTAIPPENVLLGDTSDTDAEDPDADDTGIVTVGVLVPALSVDKTITDITRGGASIGISGPVEPGDVVSYRFAVTNVGGATAYEVEFSDTLPPGMQTVVGGTYSVSAPADSGSLGLAAGAVTFTTTLGATIAGGAVLAADFTAVVTSGIEQGVDLVNTAEAIGFDGFGTEIPDANPAIGDTSDSDAEDPDADDTGIAVIGTEKPALSVDKIITQIIRRGLSIGIAEPVEPGDVVFYSYTIRNVGLGTAYNVDFTDTLPVGMVTEINAPGIAGSYDVTDPSVSNAPLAGLADGVSAFTTTIHATIDGGGQLVAQYTAYVTSAIQQGVDLINVAAATGVDGAGNPIPSENADVGDVSDDDAEDPDADDTGIVILETRQPALTLDKRVTNVIRGGVPIGIVDPLLYLDVVEYTVTIRNVGLGTAYAVEFTDSIPAGLETETTAPGNSGSYTVSSPSTSGSLLLPDGATTFSTSIDATLNGGAELTAVYTVLVTPSAAPGIDLVNTVSTAGVDGAGTQIPPENASIGDTSDDDVEDPDADDTGIASVRVGAPALVTRKSVVSINRQGTTLTDSIVEPGDVVTYEVAVANVGTGPAQAVNMRDILPAGFHYQGHTVASWPSGSSTSDPTGVPGPTLVWTLNANLDSGEELVVRFDVLVTSQIQQGKVYTNIVIATGKDSVGTPIPPDNRSVAPEDDDPDDSSAVSLMGAVPALITDKAILNVVRNGSSLGAKDTVQAFDLVTYQLLVTNVGGGTAYEVGVRDALPSPFSFVSSSTQGTWPYRIGVFTRNPTGAPGPALLWDTDATLSPGDTLTLTFEALVNGGVNPGSVYTNVLEAEGTDGLGTQIPPNRSGDVPSDTDLDDRDDVSLTGIAEVPALVTTKRVTEIIRSGAPLYDNRIEEGDIVEFALTVQNVGAATASNVNITDQLPTAFGYVDATSSAAWPLGSSFADPFAGFSGLQWSLNATLRPGDRLEIRFLAFVTGPIYDGSAYTNTMKATGLDPSGTAIPEDQRESVPGDVDPDDASQVTLIGRSAYAQGEGGSLVPLPILRKTSEVLSDNVCETWNATVDRLWFQTDIAMYAAAEFELLHSVPDAASLIPESLLPTWIRTVGSETADYAFDNLMQVDVLSSLGVGLIHAPLILEQAEARNLSATAILEQRLSELATRAEVANASLPLAEQWIFLEYEGGEPIYDVWDDGLLGPSGHWTVTDEDIVASALGMGLVKQSMEIETLLASAVPLDHFLGWVLLDILSNKIIALESNLTLRPDHNTPYIPHASRWNLDTSDTTVVDDDSTLFDQLSLLWGLSEASSLVGSLESAWPAEESDLRNRVLHSVANVLHETLVAINALHLTADRQWINRVGPGQANGDAATTRDLGLLLVALESAQDVVAESDREMLTDLQRLAIIALIARQNDAGWFSVAETSIPENAWALLPQLAGIRGLVAGSDLVVGALTSAQSAFNALDDRMWVGEMGSGLYASFATSDEKVYCYTPLEIGLATGALRELALQSTEERSAHILSRMSGFIRTIVDDAALQLANASPANASFSHLSSTGTIAPVSTDGILGRLAPVLQQRLCLDNENPGEDSCRGWSVVERDPWYQTDISMFAAFVIQDRVAAIEDYADANLNAVTLHSGLGIRFDDMPDLQSAIEGFASETNFPLVADSLAPIAIPYAAGSPETGMNTLTWNPSTFDTRVLASAQGMTLLREAQEARQLLDLEDRESYEAFRQRVLLASILQKIVVLRELQQLGPNDVSYVPHATARNLGAAYSWNTLDRGSSIFDQLSLLLGLSETYSLLSDSRIESILDAQPFPSTDWRSMVLGLAEDVMRTLEVAHLDPVADILVEEASPTLSGWIRSDSVSLVNLGMLATALNHILESFGESSSIGSRALVLLSKEVSFLRETLVDARGGFDESWPVIPESSVDCDRQTFAGQTAALRALQIAQRWLGLKAEVVLDAFKTLDARFWDPSLFVYRTQSSLLEWCVTPLDFALAVDALSRMANQLTGVDRWQLETRLASHIDRILDGVPLHLPGGLVSSQAPSIAAERSLAPVFDALACFQSPVLSQGADWAEPGDTIRYTLSAENITDETFYNLVLEDLLPAGVTVIATDPVREQDNPLIQWSFDDLLPTEERTWQILARVDADTAVGDLLQNCATLTYENVAGEPQPPREACADVEIQSQETGMAGVLETLEAEYMTDEAMHLATALDALACIPDLNWRYATLAHELADENVGVLLGESGLGVPVRYAPQLPTTDNRTVSLEDTLNRFALASDLPEIPSFGSSIFLPYESGVPTLANGLGFPPTSAVITPAALGWTLAREAQYVVSCARTDTPLHRYLAAWVRFALDNQLSWIATSTILNESGAPYLPHALRAIVAGEDVSYGVSDTRSTVYDQASLLIGLIAAAQPGVLDSRGQRLAEQLATETFEQLVRHWNPEIRAFAEPLETADASSVARWYDHSMAAKAIAMSRDILTRERSTADSILSAMAQRALDQGSEVHAIEEASRLLVLILAGDSLGDLGYQSAVLGDWRAFMAQAYRPEIDGYILSPQAVRGWGHTPGQLSVIVDLLAALATHPSEQADALRAASRLLLTHIVEDRVQLISPTHFWDLHTHSRCLGIASVFARHSGILPVWFGLMP
ncbi:DUF11 domain-containing protein [Candidatus Bipolaricaulota bacterium]|nr:DUF11 domain-containing protein [Candidatus Bipolaricaulota bacterium]